jgi:hypothetical protein
MKRYRWLLVIPILAVTACGGDQKSSDERTKEAQRAMQEGAEKERRMYEGMQKGVEGLEKKAGEKTK